MKEQIDRLLQMSEECRRMGEVELANNFRNTANRILDYVLWAKEGTK